MYCSEGKAHNLYLSLRSWFFTTWHLLQWLMICIPAKYRGTRAISAGKVAQLPPAMSETTEPTPASVRCPQSVRQRPVTCRGSDSETWRWSLARRRSSKHHPLSQSWHYPDTILTPSWHPTMQTVSPSPGQYLHIPIPLPPLVWCASVYQPR